MDTNTWLAEIELLESGEVTAAKYIKVKSSDIEGKTDAQLATYFNNSSPVEKAVFENETTHGSATVNKKNQTGGNVSDTEFAVMKVSEEGIFTADDINTIIKDASMKTHMVSKTTDSNGQAVFDNLTIFKDGQGEFTKQTVMLYGPTVPTIIYQVLQHIRHTVCLSTNRQRVTPRITHFPTSHFLLRVSTMLHMIMLTAQLQCLRQAVTE